MQVILINQVQFVAPLQSCEVNITYYFRNDSTVFDEELAQEATEPVKVTGMIGQPSQT